MTLQLFAHPFSSYCQKVLIALWADETPFEYRMLDEEHPENFAELKERWPFGKFPLLVDDGASVIETTPIIEHLHAHHRGSNDWIPEGDAGRRTRLLDRFFDIYVMTNMQKAGLDILRPEGSRDPYGVEQARAELRAAYDWLEANLGDGPWAIGDRFTLADCAAAPSLFYADWLEEIGPGRPRLAEYRARLLAHPIVARAVDEGRPYRKFFPMGAPDRDYNAHMKTRASIWFAAAAGLSLASSAPAQAATETAVLAGGCFWGMEAVFEHVKGVRDVVSGYAGGSAKDASYGKVSSERTGHAEAVRISFDPRQVSYAQLLRIYFAVAHDPTQVNRQGPDVGPSYRSAIFPQSDAQRRLAASFIRQLRAAKKPIATKIESGPFYLAEAHHQDFVRRNPFHPYVVVHDRPKLAKLKRAYPQYWKA